MSNRFPVFTLRFVAVLVTEFVLLVILGMWFLSAAACSPPPPPVPAGAPTLPDIDLTPQPAAALGAINVGAVLTPLEPRAMVQDVEDEPEHYGVERVIDGDTIVLEGGERVRLRGIDTPERGEPFHDAATLRVVSLLDLAGHVVTLTWDSARRTTDQYGRSLAYVWVDIPGEGLVDVGTQLVGEGLARSTPQYVSDYREYYNAVERDAQAAGLGIWHEVEP